MQRTFLLGLRGRIFASTIFAAVLIPIATARAVPVDVYDQAPELPFVAASSQFFPVVSMFGFNVFDNFTLGSTETVSSVKWLGSYFNILEPLNNPASPNAVGFGIDFFTSSSGAPGALLSSTTLTLAQVDETLVGTQTGFGNLNISVPLYSYMADLAAPFTVIGGTEYWIRIYSLSALPAADVAQWGWVGSLAGDQRSIQMSGFDPTFLSVSPRDRAFTLQAVPEPATVLLLGCGAALVPFRRKSQALH